MIKSNTFIDITFKSITFGWFDYVDSLERIHTNAFNSHIHTLKQFQFLDWSIALPSSEPIINHPPDYNIFEMLSSLVNLEALVFESKLIESIPDKAFQSLNGLQNKFLY